MADYRTAQVDAPGGPLRVIDREAEPPGPGMVRIAVEACGICHSDSAFVIGYLPGLAFPVTPGHEVAGRIDAVGEGADGWQVGDRVAVGWFGGYCTRCRTCRRGDFVHCENARIPGLSYRGGYAEMLTVPATAPARIPPELSAVQAAPLACAGVTVYGALRDSAARPGDLVVVLGLGGLGHLGVQYAAKMGFDTVAVARGPEKEQLARHLGARHYIDSTAQDVSAELLKRGGARVVLATAANSAAMASGLDALAPRGELLAVGITPEPMPISPLQLNVPGRVVRGHPAGSPADIEDAMAFAALTGVRAMVEEVPLERAAEAYERMMRNEARFRLVLTMS
jgi:alcohol dehydrogenase